MSSQRIKRKPSRKELKREILGSMRADANDEPRISSTKLAKLLGISHDEMRRFVESHRQELEEIAPLPNSPIVN